MNIAIAIPTCGGAEDRLSNTIREIAFGLTPSDRLLIIDNGGKLKDRPLHLSENIEIIKPGENLGYPRAINLALKYSDEDIFIAANDDIEVPPDFASRIREGLEEPDVAFVGPNGFFVGLDYSPEFGTPFFRREVDYVEGSFIAARRETWLAYGGFDDIFHPGYSEDFDICERARRDGMRNLQIPIPGFRHIGAQTSKDIFSTRRFWELVMRHRDYLALRFGFPYVSKTKWKLPISRLAIGFDPEPWHAETDNLFPSKFANRFIVERMEFLQDIRVDKPEELNGRSGYALLIREEDFWPQILKNNLNRALSLINSESPNVAFNTSWGHPEMRIFDLDQVKLEGGQIVCQNGKCAVFEIMTSDPRTGRPIARWACIERKEDYDLLRRANTHVHRTIYAGRENIPR